MVLIPKYVLIRSSAERTWCLTVHPGEATGMRCVPGKAVRLGLREEVLEEAVDVDDSEGVLRRPVGQGEGLAPEGRREFVKGRGVRRRDITAVGQGSQVRDGHNEEVLRWSLGSNTKCEELERDAPLLPCYAAL
jgi:hypothetical protein